MLTKKDKTKYRNLLFRHLDGLATATTAFSLHKKGVLDYLLQQKKISLTTLTKQFNANVGYLNVGLRVLCSQGWLTQHINSSNGTIIYEINEKSKIAFALVPLYEDAVNLLQYSVLFPKERIGADAFIALERIFKKLENNYIKFKKHFRNKMF